MEGDVAMKDFVDLDESGSDGEAGSEKGEAGRGADFDGGEGVNCGGDAGEVRAEEEDLEEADAEMEEAEEEDEERSEDDELFIDDEEDANPDGGADAEGEELNAEVQLSDAEIEGLVRELMEVESKAAEAQEALEKESLDRVENEVREELAQSLAGDELENAVSTEMSTFIEQWEAVLDEIETESSLLLEQLDGAGIELPSLFRLIETQAPNSSVTEAWRKRTHWTGCDVTADVRETVISAEKYLQSCRPVRRQHGRLLEEGASGFLARKLDINDGSGIEENSGTWTSFTEFIASNKDSEDCLSFGSKSWAAVYLASTPRQAASLGLKLPGVDEVAEIDEINLDCSDPFYADAIRNEQVIELSEEQQRKFRKVTEENDAIVTKKLQHLLKRRRLTRHNYQMTASDDRKPGCEYKEGIGSSCHISCTSHTEDDILPKEALGANNGLNLDIQSKSCQAIVLDSDDDIDIVERKVKRPCTQTKCEAIASDLMKDGLDIINVDVDPVPIPHGLFTTDACKDFRCTACFKALPASEVCRHPILDVIICETCNSIVEDKMQKVDGILDIDSDGYCRWCGKCANLVSCSFCNMSFCSTCVCTNMGEEQLLLSKSSSWRCYSCEPNLLHKLVMECNLAFGITAVSSSSSENSDSVPNGTKRKRKHKRKIRRILDDAELADETKQKIELEKARQEHLKSMKYAQQPLNNVLVDDISSEIMNTEMYGDAESGYIVNAFREENEDPVRIPPSTSVWLKPHQIAGIRFMWQNIIQSVKKVKSGDKGLGCILAHTMGLGKTFQVITFLYAAMRSVDLGLKNALIVTPVNVLHNWRQEFSKWKPLELKRLRIFMLEDVPRDKRTCLLSKWKEKGGILLIGYASFRNLTLGKYMKDRATAVEICHALQNSPDILVCDEAHMIKNKRADTTQALKQIKTQRRIALTGSPLQNNLMEYFCMVDFVREGFLGSSHEFRNRFQNPIENGQHTNSTADDVKIMNQRSHILYEQLKGFVQRMNLNVVKKDLPPKTVYVISVKLSPLQRKLYKRFLDVHGFTGEKFSNDRNIRRCFFAGYQALAQIWNHPGLLQMAKQHRESLTREDIVENFLEDDSSSDDNIDHSDVIDGDRQNRSDTVQKRDEGIFLNEEIDWWQDLLREKIYKEPDYSGKMVLLLDILRMSSQAGDKVLIFSQSLATLDLVELYLSKLSRGGNEGKYWKQGKDWYRLDGKTAGVDRQKLVERFNDPSNNKVKCTLISTRAGSLGINLYAANRVIIVDGSWNPTNDLQAIYRAWRYGQVKPVYAYRLMAHGTMEEKIYKRQVTKEGLAARVVDRQQIHRTMSREEVLHLFEFGDDEIAEMGLELNHEHPDHYQSGNLASFLKQKSLSLSDGVGLSDKLMEDLLNRHHQRWIQDFHEHEMLLQENEEERLSKEEQDMAWDTFLRSLQWEEVNRVSVEEQPPVAEPKPPRHPLHTEYRKPPSVSEIQHQALHAPSLPETSNVTQVKGNSRNSRPPSHPRKCSNLSHLLTLRSKGTKSGSSTICGECSQEISWENLNRDSRIR